MTLNEIKILRLHDNKMMTNAGTWRRYFYRYLQLVSRYSAVKAHLYILNRLFTKIILKLVSAKRTSYKSTKNFTYAVLITGGVGDGIVIARLIRDIQLYLDYKFEFDIYFHSPKMINQIYLNIKGFRDIFDADLYQRSKNFYDFSLFANTFLTFNNELINYPFLLSESRAVLKLFSNVESFRKKEKIEDFIRAHPFLDGAFADRQSLQGRSRYDFMHEMIGVPYTGHLLNINKDINILSKYNLNNIKYITVHDGWDENFKFISSRPTKSIPINTWTFIIQQIKLKFPNHLIVQIGGLKGQLIDGVDIYLKNKITFEDAISIIGFSYLHFDSESGLVHLASALGIKSVVFFGPTNYKWFSYPENININPIECGNCWWSTETWMNTCPVGYIEPKCIKHNEDNIVQIFNRKVISNV
jgi:hypothetical protein